MTRKVFRLAIAAFVLWTLVTPTTTQAIAPSNDDFDNATPITALPFTDTVNTSEATTAADDPNCVGQGPTVWYAFTPSADIILEANTFGSSYDTTLSAYTGQRGALTQIACNDDSFGLQSRVTFTASAGVTIFFMAGAFASGPGGDLVFNLMEAGPPPPPPPNDDLRNATVIAGLPFTDMIDTTGATTAADDPDCVGQGPTVWYSFTPSTDLLIEANTFGSDYDTTLSAYTIKGRTLTQIACNDDTFGLQSRISFTAKARVRVLFMVGAFASGPGGNLVFNVSELPVPPPGPANDNRENATVITGLPFTDSIDTTTATRAPDDQFCHSGSGNTPTVWYAFTPCIPVTIRADTFGSSYDTTLSVWTEGEFGNLQLVECNNDAGVIVPSQVFFDASPGVTYFFMVDSFAGGPGGTLQFHVDVHTPPPELAELVIGQPGFLGQGCNSFGRDASSICFPTGADVDAAGNLYVADRGNHRVLVYLDPLSTDMVADRVIGQPNFFTGTCNTGGRSASSLCGPTEVALDNAGNLYVAEITNNRVLVYFSPLTTDAVADRVFGQPDFATGTCNTGGLSASSLCVPSGVAVDFAGNLYVGEFSNSRALVYFSPLTTDAVADRVFGQPDFATGTCNTGGQTAGSLCVATGVDVDAAGNLYVSDSGNARVLEYDSPLTTDAVADRVFGQPDFLTSPNGLISLPGGQGCTPPTASSLCDPRGVAVDVAGNLYVADSGISANIQPSSRVVVYKNPLTTDAVADQVFGQPDFTSAGCNGGDFFAHAYTLCTPRGVAVDATGNLYVADTVNSRVLVHEADADSDGIRDSLDGCPSEAPTRGLDADRNGCTDTLDGLQAIVKGLPMRPAVKQGLLGKLDEAEKALSRGNTMVAVNKLHDFINQVEGARGRGIKDCDADLLVDYANNLITLISP